MQPSSTVGELVRAEISTAVDIPNSFAMRLELTALADQGQLLFGPYQGARRAIGYRLGYNPGQRPVLELLSVTSRRVRVIDTVETGLTLDDGKPHVLEWSRGADGSMTVSLDQREVMRSRDTGFKDPFNGFTLANDGGDYRLRSITISGAK